jgi:hypothetical protein
MTDQNQPTDWDTLAQSIEDGEAVLVLGPDAIPFYPASSGNNLETESTFSQLSRNRVLELPEGQIQHFYRRDNLFQFRDAAAKQSAMKCVREAARARRLYEACLRLGGEAGCFRKKMAELEAVWKERGERGANRHKSPPHHLPAGASRRCFHPVVKHAGRQYCPIQSEALKTGAERAGLCKNLPPGRVEHRQRGLAGLRQIKPDARALMPGIRLVGIQFKTLCLHHRGFGACKTQSRRHRLHAVVSLRKPVGFRSRNPARKGRYLIECAGLGCPEPKRERRSAGAVPTDRDGRFGWKHRKMLGAHTVAGQNFQHFQPRMREGELVSKQ